MDAPFKVFFPVRVNFGLRVAMKDVILRFVFLKT